MVVSGLGVGLCKLFDEGAFLSGEGGFFLDLALETHQPFEEGFWARGASRDIHIDGDEVIDPLEHGVGAVHPTAGGTSAHGDAPFRFGHLVPDAFDGECHLVGDRSSDDHDVGLARGEAHDFGSEPRDVEP